MTVLVGSHALNAPALSWKNEAFELVSIRLPVIFGSSHWNLTRDVTAHAASEKLRS